MPEFKIEQIALCPPDDTAARMLLADMGITDWVRDTVVASGQVFGAPAANVAELAFNYTGLKHAYELEVLSYTDGENWMAARPGQGARISHLGMHCTADELEEWRVFFAERGITVAQEVLTEKHRNAEIAGLRWYQYVIFNTYPILGVDIKLIVRKEAPPQ